MLATVNNLVKKLATHITEKNAFNPYNQLSKATDDRTAPGIRQQNLRLYLESHEKLKTKVIWAYLFPTYEEAKRSGVPMGNSNTFRQIEEILNTDRKFEKATKIKRIPNSSSMSEILWNTAEEIGINPIIWPVIPFYLHNPGARKTKRKPKADEVEMYGEYFKLILEIYQPKNILAIGKDTKNALDQLKIKSKYIQHPRRGIKAFKKTVSRYK